MLVDKIKRKMKENKISQKKLAELMMIKSGRYYNQSMISKHLSHDKKLNVAEEILMIEVINTYDQSNDVIK